VPKFPIDAPKRKVLRALLKLGFEIVREAEHIALIRRNIDGTVTTMTIANHPMLNSGTLHRALTGCGVSTADFISAYYSK
jgi:hypothetical protein